MRTWLQKPELMRLAGFTCAAKQVLEADGLQLILLSLSIIIQHRHPPSSFSAVDNYSIYDNVLFAEYPLETKTFSN